MTAPKRYKRISVRTSNLLREGKSERSDFKRAPEGVSADDLVAFANGDIGGSILAGVDERTGHGGVQVGFIVGCDVSDAAILQITNKALSCFPPVAIKISIEGIGKTPFLRIDIPSSPTKPHCTPKGIYCRRDGVRNRPLHPTELLRIFLESEARVFAERFEAAAARISEDISQLEASLDGSIREMADQLGWAGTQLGDTENTLSTILSYVHRINNESSDLTSRMRAMFRQDKRKDPIFDRERKKMLDGFVDQLRKDEKLMKDIQAGGKVSVKFQGKVAEELTQDDFNSLLHEALRIVNDQAKKDKSAN